MPRSLTTHIDSPKKFGERLKQSRKLIGLSQRQLAFAGCTAAYISRLETGARVPSLQMVRALAEKLGVSADWLATGQESAEGNAQTTMSAEEAANFRSFKDVLPNERAFLRQVLQSYRHIRELDRKHPD